MEQARSLHDCYFYYYSTCRKGNTCTFRHFEGALGHEEACKLFLEGKCYNPMCTMRHMKIQVRILQCVLPYLLTQVVLETSQGHTMLLGTAAEWMSQASLRFSTQKSSQSNDESGDSNATSQRGNDPDASSWNCWTHLGAPNLVNADAMENYESELVTFFLFDY